MKNCICFINSSSIEVPPNGCLIFKTKPPLTIKFSLNTKGLGIWLLNLYIDKYTAKTKTRSSLSRPEYRQLNIAYEAKGIQKLLKCAVKISIFGFWVKRFTRLETLFYCFLFLNRSSSTKASRINCDNILLQLTVVPIVL